MSKTDATEAATRQWEDAIDAVSTAATVAPHPEASTLSAADRDEVLDTVRALGTRTGQHDRNAGGAEVTFHFDAIVEAYEEATSAGERTVLVSNAVHVAGSDAEAATLVALVLGYVASTRGSGANGLWGSIGDALNIGGPGAARSAYARAVQGTVDTIPGAQASSSSSWATAHGKRYEALNAMRGRKEALVTIAE